MIARRKPSRMAKVRKATAVHACAAHQVEISNEKVKAMHGDSLL